MFTTHRLSVVLPPAQQRLVWRTVDFTAFTLIDVEIRVPFLSQPSIKPHTSHHVGHEAKLGHQTTSAN